MKLNLDTQWLRTSMELWREVVEMRVPVRDDLKVHLMSHRASNLANFIEVGKSWKTVLGSCTPTDPQDQVEFEALITQIDAFVAWARLSLDELKVLGQEEAFTDTAQDLLSDHEFGSAIRDLLYAIRKQNPDNGNDAKGHGTSGV
jgi:hypothetical protein